MKKEKLSKGGSRFLTFWISFFCFTALMFILNPRNQFVLGWISATAILAIGTIIIAKSNNKKEEKKNANM